MTDQLSTVLPFEETGEFEGNSSNLDNNFWAVFDQQYLRHSLGWTIALVITYSLILVVGVIGNCMVILVVLFRPQMRTVTNMFIMNLAVADLFVIVFCVPPTLLSNVFAPWVLGSFMCKGVAYVQGVSVCASAYSLAAISIDRCKAIYQPLKRPRGLSKFQAFAVICFTWVIAILMTIPWAVVFNVIRNTSDGLSYCVETWKNEQHGKLYFLVANLFAFYCLPLCLISISNIVIWCHVTNRQVPHEIAAISTIKKIHKKTKHGVRKMLAIVTMTFLLSWLPLYSLVTIMKFSKNINEDEVSFLGILLPFAQWLGSWNSCINPVLYAFLNNKFREMFKSLLPTWLPFVPKNKERVIVRNNVNRLNAPTKFSVDAVRTVAIFTLFTTKNNEEKNYKYGSKSFQYRKNFYRQRTLLVSSLENSDKITTSVAADGLANFGRKEIGTFPVVNSGLATKANV